MKIAAAFVGMEAARKYKEVEQTIVESGSGIGAGSGGEDEFTLRLFKSIQSTSQATTICSSTVRCAANTESEGLREETIHSGLARLTAQILDNPVRLVAEQPLATAQIQEPANLPAGTIVQSTVTQRIVYQELEQTLYAVQGQVQTEDGRLIDFEMGIGLERQTVAVAEYSSRLTIFTDPLLLQFATDGPLLEDCCFSFDLDGDGSQEELALPGAGTGFLAYDRNQDGCINNGTELFGPNTGSGFAELAGLDGDGNLWIDENDPLFSSLLLWQPSADGEGRLLSLAEAGVGALSVLHAGTEFALQRSDGTALGRIQASGIFLTENGEVRSLQEVELAQEKAAPATQAVDDQDAWLGLQHDSLAALREIIAVQRVRLRLLLANQHLLKRAQHIEQQRSLWSWLDTREQWEQQRLQASAYLSPATAQSPDSEEVKED